jgi:GNAT superfamily N-acetyltransferase
MSVLRIVDVETDNIDGFVKICIPEKWAGDKEFIEGYEIKCRWVSSVLKDYGSIGKIAYLDDIPVGMIQYLPRIDEKVYEITCIFVLEEYTRRGIGRKLFDEAFNECCKPKPFFGDDVADAIVTWAFEVPGLYSQRKFFLKMGFIPADPSDPRLLYYPLKEGYIYKPRKAEYKALEEDCGRAVIFIGAVCPFSVYFANKIKELINEVSEGYPIKFIYSFDEPEEVEKRGGYSYCIVNGYPIQSFFLDKESFKKEVSDAISRPCGYRI